jgi:2-amino-4-hydroxy-6-hydroxymethyldihydropteridine diphosphokinase
MRVLLSLGSNLGDREANLRAALKALEQREGVRLTACSDVYETEPVGYMDQPAFLNMAAEIETDLEPLELLNAVEAIEGRLGREKGVRWGPRVIDMDIVLCGSKTMDSERLTLPHPEFRRRAFVLVPLAEIAPEAVDPITGKTVAELASSPEAEGRVEKRSSLLD